MGVEDYFKLGRHKARPLNNPLAAEFGIYDERQLDEFILNHLPGFALVRNFLSCVSFALLCLASCVREAVSAVCLSSKPCGIRTCIRSACDNTIHISRVASRVICAGGVLVCSRVCVLVFFSLFLLDVPFTYLAKTHQPADSFDPIQQYSTRYDNFCGDLKGVRKK